MPTRQGWAAVLAAVAAFAIGRVFGLVELYVVGAGLVAAMVLGLLSVARRVPDLHVQRVILPSTVAVGEVARVDVQVTNAGRRHSPHLRIWEPVGDDGGAPMQLAPLAPGEAASAAYRVPTTARGELRLGPVRARRYDVLGVAVRTMRLAGSDPLLVVPQHVLLPFPTIGSAGRLGEHLRMRAWGQTGGEFHSLRDYAAGDDLRRVHWKASARSPGLLVRETTLEGIRRCSVVLDTSHAEFDPDAFERAVHAAASVVVSSAAAGVATRLVASDIDLRGPDISERSLRWLALVTPGEELIDAATISRGAGEGMGLVVLVTASTSSPSVAIAGQATGPEESLVVISCGRPPQARASDRKRFDVDASAPHSLIGSWHALVAGAAASRPR